MVAYGGIEQFYLKHVAKYNSLVNAFEPIPKPHASAAEPAPDVVVATRIKPLLEDEGFPSAIFARAMQPNAVDIHDLYNHPSGFPRLKV